MKFTNLKREYAKPILFLCITIIVIFISCKKTDNTTILSDCQKNNYGTLKVTFGSSTIKHEIRTITLFDRDKIVNTGILSDTLHLRSDSYYVSIASINDMGGYIDHKDTVVIITQCKELNVSVIF